MPGPAKRTRTELNLEGHDESLTMPTTPSSSARPPPQPRRISTTPITPSRPIPTRSATSTLPNTPTHLTRSTSLFIPTRLGLGTNGGGTLSRTQSTSSIPFAAPSKASVAPGGGGIDGKGGDTDMDWTGARRLGKGKENIPPRKDEEQQGDASRKRVKISRGRSGSVTSMRSEVFGT